MPLNLILNDSIDSIANGKIADDFVKLIWWNSAKKDNLKFGIFGISTKGGFKQKKLHLYFVIKISLYNLNM
jgi:hypothetical protein